MHCPSCGHKNSNLATRCAACGSILPETGGTSSPTPDAMSSPTPDATSSPAPSSPMNSASAQEPVLTPKATAASEPAVAPAAQQPMAESEPVAAPSAEPTSDPAFVSALDFAPEESSQDTTTPLSSGNTAERPQSAFVTPDFTSPEDDPNLREAPRDSDKTSSIKQHRVSQFLSQHQRALGIGLALAVIAVLGVVWFVINLLDAPTYAKIEQDLAERLSAYEYVGGAYGPDREVSLSNITVKERSSTKTPEGMEAGEGVGSAAYDVEAQATYDDGVIQAVRNVGATYVRNDGEWTIVGELDERGASVVARAGVDEQKVLDNVGTILEAASTSGGTSLADIYSDGTFAVVGNVFKDEDPNAITDDVTIHCEKENGFYAYEGDVVASFSFESGTWELRGVEASGQATTRSFTPLVGAWGGELSSSKSNGATCYGARGHNLELSIDTVDDLSDGRREVQGTITVLAHRHEKLIREQESNKDDVVLENVSFTGSFWAEPDEGMSSSLTIECTTTESANEGLSFELTFGTDDDPSAAIARVTSTYAYDEPVLLFIPHQTTAEYVDTYALWREQE